MLEEKKPEDIQGEYIRYFFGGGGGWGGYDADPGCIAFFLNEGKPFYRLSEQMANYQNTKDSLYEIRIHRKSIDLVDYFKLKNAYLKSGIVEMSLVATIKPFTCMDCDHFFYDSRIDGKQILVSWLSEWHDADDDYVPDTTCTVDSNKFYHSKFLYLARKLSGFEPEDTEKFRIHFGIEE